MTSIISATNLKALIGNENLLIIDATSGPRAKEIYTEKHLTGAQFVDLEKDLSTIDDPAHGGRHPLPSPQDFSKTLTNLRVHDDSHIVVYDRANGVNAAARFWWMARAAGLKNVQVLDGGFSAAEAMDIPIESGEITGLPQSSFCFDTWQLPTITRAEVEALTHDPKAVIIDVREEARYAGVTEPIDLIAGHIPSAINIPLANNLDSNGLFKDPQALYAYYKPFFVEADAQKRVVHCGSGVSACHTLLALDYAGFEMPHLYVGSWSEWSRNALPIATTAS
ncbi:sulfurtransferase [Sphingobacterium oryzagri]|uniref:Sulfurtransferase n=1 Tax=Sphingobacterium oryzagri TaxID=3025669 RepID=A0ABY7WM75_9SPHI|nr:sulfurtransferase [Sphingobacterium sp. KACC 22765]WDF70701.1 sulfurtransferase [Sphingobacterium sp. KACC 22765]